MTFLNPLAGLIDKRLSELRLSKYDLVQKLGYQNTSKGLNRLNQIYLSNLRQSDFLLSQLPEVLGLTLSQVQNAKALALKNNEQQDREVSERNFRPHAVYLTEHTRPLQIIIAGIIGAYEQRYCYFDDGIDPATFKVIALEKMPKSIMTFGRVYGFIVNYSTKLAAHYDLDGNFIESLDKQKLLGQPRIRL